MISPIINYLDFIKNIFNENENININIKNISSLDSFKNFRKENLINFGEASQIDQFIFGHSGNYWLSAYSYPREGDEIIIGNIVIGVAINVGLLTFNIV
jgi:hypothetical protein